MGKENRIHPSEGLEAELLAEVNFFCPLCKKALSEQKGSRLYKRYQIAHIYPHSATEEQKRVLAGVPRAADLESRENLIPLCKDCHGRQDFHTRKDEYLRLYAKKQESAGGYQARKIAADSPLEPEIKQIICALTKDISTTRADLSLTPLFVRKKVSDKLLCEKVLSYVTQYFTFVRNEFKKLQPETAFELIACQFKQFFLQAEKSLIKQDQIFDQLVEWVANKTQASRVASEIVVSFFIQNCEVFRETSK